MGSTWWGILLTRCGLLVENNTFYRTAEERRQRCWRYLIMHSLPLYYTNPIPPLLILFACLPIRSGLFGAADIERDPTGGERQRVQEVGEPEDTHIAGKRSRSVGRNTGCIRRIPPWSRNCPLSNPNNPYRVGIHFLEFCPSSTSPLETTLASDLDLLGPRRRQLDLLRRIAAFHWKFPSVL